MDLGDYWQENKRFVTTAGAGILVFFLAFLMLNNAYGKDAQQARSELRRVRTELGAPRFNSDDAARADDQHESLQSAFSALRGGVVFEPRPEFRIDAALGTPQIQYFQNVERVRTELGRLAGRRRAVLPDGLGLEPLKTLNVETIARHLEALDLLDRALHMAIESGVRQVSSVRVTLDPSFSSKSGVDEVEKTQVAIKLVGGSEAVAGFLADSQSARYGKPLTIQRYDFKSAKAKRTEVSGEVVFLAVRVHEQVVAEEEE